jgi:hypothetical protein
VLFLTFIYLKTLDLCRQSEEIPILNMDWFGESCGSTKSTALVTLIREFKESNKVTTDLTTDADRRHTDAAIVLLVAPSTLRSAVTRAYVAAYNSGVLGRGMHPK